MKKLVMMMAMVLLAAPAFANVLVVQDLSGNRFEVTGAELAKLAMPMGIEDFTFEIWVSLNSYTAQNTSANPLAHWGDFGNSGGHFDPGLRGDYPPGKDSFEVWGGNVDNRGEVPDNTWANKAASHDWFHIAITNDLGPGDTLEVVTYYNGALVPDNNDNRHMEITALQGGLTIGGFPATFQGEQSLDGCLDEVRIWAGVRTAQEIADNYDKILTGGEAGLVAYYNFEGATDVIRRTDLVDGAVGDLIGNAFIDLTKNAPVTGGGVIPEPAGLGLIGLALLAVRRRRS